MKLAMFANSPVFAEKQTGGQKRFKELYLYLREKYDVTLYSTDLPSEIGLKGYSHVALKRVVSTKLSFVSSNEKLKQVNRGIINSINHQNYDQVIVFDVTTAWILVSLNVKNISMLVRQDLIEYKTISLNSHNVSRLKASIYLALMRYCERKCLRRVNKVVVQCKYDKDNLIVRHSKYKSELENKIQVQINNVNPSWIVNNAKDCGKKSADFPYFCIGFVGSVDDYRKGFDFLERYLYEYREDETVGALVIGGGVKLTSLKDKFKDNNRISFLGRINNPMNYISQCDLMVVPSRADSCPNTVLEPLYIGIPVIGANAGGIPEILNDQDALFDLSNTSFEEKINTLKRNTAKYDALCERQNKRKTELEFNWAERISKLLGIGVAE